MKAGSKCFKFGFVRSNFRFLCLLFWTFQSQKRNHCRAMSLDRAAITAWIFCVLMRLQNLPSCRLNSYLYPPFSSSGFLSCILFLFYTVRDTLVFLVSILLRSYPFKYHLVALCSFPPSIALPHFDTFLSTAIKRSTTSLFILSSFVPFKLLTHPSTNYLASFHFQRSNLTLLSSIQLLSASVPYPSTLIIFSSTYSTPPNPKSL